MEERGFPVPCGSNDKGDAMAGHLREHARESISGEGMKRCNVQRGQRCLANRHFLSPQGTWGVPCTPWQGKRARAECGIRENPNLLSLEAPARCEQVCEPPRSQATRESE